MRILFWGTSDFAVPGLRALIGEGHQVVAVITQPDRPAGRGRKLRPTPIRAAAEEEGIPVLTPERPRGEEFFNSLRALEPEISVVAAYGHILLPECLEIPVRGSINVHASLLPELRGAAPVNWAIARGHEKTGVTIMRMSAGMDEGPILLQREIPIGREETASELYQRLSELGAEELLQALALLEIGELPEREQDHARATYAPKVDRETARIDWSRTPHEVANHIRGMDEVPGGWSALDGEPFKLFGPKFPSMEGRVESAAWEGDAPGTIVAASPTAGLLVAAGGGLLGIEEVQPPGGRRMSAREWLRGRKIAVGAGFQ